MHPQTHFGVHDVGDPKKPFGTRRGFRKFNGFSPPWHADQEDGRDDTLMLWMGVEEIGSVAICQLSRDIRTLRVDVIGKAIITDWKAAWSCDF